METLLSMTFRLCKRGKLVHRINWTCLRIGVQCISGTGMEEILTAVEVLYMEICAKFYYFKFIYTVKLILEICSSRLQKKSSSLRLSKEDVEIVQATVLFL